MRKASAGVSGFVRAALLGSTALAALSAQPVLAQDEEPAATDSNTGNAIIVTATKRERTLQDVPVAVTVTPAETLERGQIRDLKDLQTVVPSLQVGQRQAVASTNFFIRGFGNGANNPGIEPSVGVFVDGVYRSRTAAQITDLPDVQRIEVLRGPQSTLFGKNASAGVISITTQKPAFDFGGAAELTYGNHDALVGKALVTGPLSENVAFSVAGGFNKRDGFFLTGDDHGVGADVGGRLNPGAQTGPLFVELLQHGHHLRGDGAQLVVGGVGREERVARRSRRLRGDPHVLDGALRQAADRSRVGGVLVGAERDRRPLGDAHGEKLLDRALGRLAVGAPERLLQAAALLPHPHLQLGEMIHAGLGRHVPQLVRARREPLERARVQHERRLVGAPLAPDARGVQQLDHFPRALVKQRAVCASMRIVGDPNVSIHEGKVFTCNVWAGRKRKK